LAVFGFDPVVGSFLSGGDLPTLDEESETDIVYEYIHPL
jgi:hypothetical protein